MESIEFILQMMVEKWDCKGMIDDLVQNLILLTGENITVSDIEKSNLKMLNLSLK